jgi:hypothetical protein
VPRRDPADFAAQVRQLVCLADRRSSAPGAQHLADRAADLVVGLLTGLRPDKAVRVGSSAALVAVQGFLPSPAFLVLDAAKDGSGVLLSGGGDDELGYRPRDDQGAIFGEGEWVTGDLP